MSDTQSGVDAASLKYAWTQSTAVPASGWSTFSSGASLSRTSGNGNWYLHVQAADKAGNVVNAVSNPFVLDNSAPTVQFNANGQATAATAAATEVTVSDTQSGIDAASLKYAWTQSTAVPVGGWSTFSSGASLSRTSGNGNWYLHVQAADKAGNVVNAVSNPFVLDSTAPTVQFNANGQATAATAAATEVTVSDTQSGVDAASLKYAWTQSTAVPAGGWSTFSSGASLSRTSGNGNWYLHVQAADKAGNIVNAVSNPFVLDNTAPTVQFTANGQAAAATAAATEVTVSDTQSGVDADSLKYAWTQSTAVPAGGWSTFSSGASLSRTSGNGNWYLHVQAADKAGNVVNAVSNPFVLDNSAPTVTVSSSAGGKVNASFPVTIIYSEGVTGFTEDDLVINNGTVSDFTSVSAVTYSAIISPTNSGQAVTITVAAGAAADAAGNDNTASNTLSLLYDKTKPVVTFGGFTDNQLFIAPPAAVTVSVNEAVYWIADGTELTSSNALPLISMKKDGEAFSAYSPGYDEPSGTFTLTFNDTLEDGEYEVLVAGDAVRNEFQNTLDAASASFTVAVPVITGISVNPASLTSSGGSTTVTITGVNLLGQTVSVYVDGVEAATAVVRSAENAEVTVDLPYNATQTANDHIFTVYLNGVEVIGQSSTVTVNAVLPPTVSYSSQADLARLQVSASGKALDLSSAFAPGTTAYTVETDAEQVELQLATADSKAIVKLLGERMDALTNVKLAMGANVLAITVQAEDGTLKTYTLTINRIAVPDPIPSTPACPFTDMENHWAKSAVCEAASLGIVEGVTEHTFAPNSYVTRTEFAIMLLRTLQINIRHEASAMSFSDSDSIPDWAEPGIRTAVAEGVVEGYSDGMLRPMQTVNRSEMAAMISRAMKWNVNSTESPSFSDDNSIPAWAKGYVEAAREHGILVGRANNQFVPEGLTTRAEAAVALLRLRNVIH
ncbi:S-layer homology domain-containing protein [Paenibacillus contaminans]|uniref:SLH domain-containing protein n=1 Tax=Paenibacillus contaminans TaxID=450362 RepID=A0A329LNM5_9BACL|nr:S-layer homology domain-containing protein [Paenibacillus contaminans]RAV08806.1 hypothetical protein DQG23_40485 [Paenibacillus contaminans]